MIVTVLPTPAPPKRPTLPPLMYGAIRSITLMPVSNTSTDGCRSRKAGGSRWIDQRSTPSIAGLSSTGCPITFQMRPSVVSPTGTEIGPPVSTTSVPRARPSVESIATARTRSSPRCCCTSATRVAVEPSGRSIWISTAWRISGRRSGKTASITTPLISMIWPVLAPFSLGMGLLKALWQIGGRSVARRRQGRRRAAVAYRNATASARANARSGIVPARPQRGRRGQALSTEMREADTSPPIVRARGAGRYAAGRPQRRVMVTVPLQQGVDTLVERAVAVVRLRDVEAIHPRAVRPVGGLRRAYGDPDLRPAAQLATREAGRTIRALSWSLRGRAVQTAFFAHRATGAWTVSTPLTHVAFPGRGPERIVAVDRPKPVGRRVRRDLLRNVVTGVAAPGCP